MKILVLGAAGKTAKAVIPYLHLLPGLERIYLADHNAEALCKQSVDLSHLPVSTRYLDAENESSLYARMEEADLVLGCLGPFHLHERRIAEAALVAGCDYLSMCDDPESTREVMSLGAEAVRNGVRVLCGCGLTPGLSDLLACRACSRLDRVDSIEFAWFLEFGPDLGAATLEHLLHSFAVKAPVRLGGSPQKARAGSWEEAVEFPPPVGVRLVSYMSHPEPFTLASAAMGARDIWFKAGMGSRAKDMAMQSLARMSEGAGMDLWKAAVHAMASAVARRGKASCHTALRVSAAGTREDTVFKRILCVVGDYYGISGLVMAAAVNGLMKKAWEPGVHTMDTVLDNRDFFAWLRHAGLHILVGEERRDEGTAGSRLPPE
jgi:hypothetical protein